MNTCPDPQDITAYLDGEYDGDPAWIAHHLIVCADCARHAAETNIVDRAVRSGCGGEQAPRRLIDWIDAHQTSRPARVSRRRMLGGFAIAAGAAGAVFFVARGVMRNEQIAPTLFQDYATLIAADGPLDLVDTDPDQVLAWFRPRIPFPLPRLPALSEIGISGARLCWLLDRRVAAIHLDSGAGGASLYLTGAKGLTLDGDRQLPSAHGPAVLSDGDLAGAFWRQGQLAYGLVGRQPDAAILDLAMRLQSDALFSPVKGNGT